jgi:hypothetical protein
LKRRALFSLPKKREKKREKRRDQDGGDKRFSLSRKMSRGDLFSALKAWEEKRSQTSSLSLAFRVKLPLRGKPRAGKLAPRAAFPSWVPRDEGEFRL